MNFKLPSFPSFDTFVYNFKWSDYVWMLDGWLPRCAIAIPLIGYVIIFNDFFSQHLSFNNISNYNDNAYGLSSSARLKLIYFGLIFLGLANLIFRINRPFIFKLGKNEFEFVKNGLSHFTLQDYIEFHNKIQEGHFTRHGKYYTEQWEDFWNLAYGDYSGGTSRR
ncbi:MAG: hypothetical protein AAF569_07140, partial [Pseudomonadota bacterium]